jgi:hypothetical protein
MSFEMHHSCQTFIFPATVEIHSLLYTFSNSQLYKKPVSYSGKYSTFIIWLGVTHILLGSLLSLKAPGHKLRPDILVLL